MLGKSKKATNISVEIFPWLRHQPFALAVLEVNQPCKSVLLNVRFNPSFGTVLAAVTVDIDVVLFEARLLAEPKLAKESDLCDIL